MTNYFPGDEQFSPTKIFPNEVFHDKVGVFKVFAKLSEKHMRCGLSLVKLQKTRIVQKNKPRSR